MMQYEKLLKNRLKDLAGKSYQSNCYTFTGFLSLSDLADFYEIERELDFVPYALSGGYPGAERVVLRFGSEALFGYEEAFPITCVQIQPLVPKFADELSHRDFLGALMNLGIERSTMGDIILKENTGWLFCLETIAPFIIEQLTKIKHTNVTCFIAEEIPIEKEEDLEEIKIQINSERIDAVAAKVYQLSRSESIELFRQKKVFINGRLCENNSCLLKEKDTISVRGYGKFIFAGNQNLSKKGKINASVLLYGKR